MEEIERNEMWKCAIEGSNWKQRAGTPELWDERVDWFEKNRVADEAPGKHAPMHISLKDRQ